MRGDKSWGASAPQLVSGTTCIATAYSRSRPVDNPRTTFGLDTFWETCDHESLNDNPLERELCFRSDALRRYSQQIEAAEELGDDEAVAVLSSHYEDTRLVISRLRDALLKQSQTPPEAQATL